MAIKKGGRGKQRTARLPAYDPRRCDECGAEYQPYKIDQRFCSQKCQTRYHGRLGYLRRHDGKPPDRERECGICGTVFPRLDRYDWRRKYCSGACAKEAKRLSRKAFHDRNPDYRKRAEMIYNGGYSSTVTRFFRRCPDTPRACAVCGESRVVDIHHKVRRNGEPPRASNTQCGDVWVLCPNHHAIIHRNVATPEELGLA